MNTTGYHTALRLCLASGRALEDELISLTWTAGCSNTASGPSLGSTVAGSIQAKLTDVGLTLVNAFLTLQTNGAEGWETLGRFRCDTAEAADGVVSITATDAMLWALERGYYPSEPTPATALGVLRDICAQCGLTLGTVSGLTDVPVSGSLMGWTAREMTGYMAALLGCNAVIGGGDTLELQWYRETEVELTAGDYYSGGYSHRDENWTLRGISVTVPGEEEQKALTAGSSEANLSLTNPYMTQSILSGIWSRRGGFSYRPGTVELPDGVDILPGDIVTVTDPAGEVCRLAVTEVKHSYDGGVKTTLTACGADESDNGSYMGPTMTAMERYAADIATVKQLYAQNLAVSGSIVTDTLSGVEINASKYLTGVTVVGDVIRAGTLTADKLLLTGRDGLIYELNAQAGSLTAAQLNSAQYQTALDGSVLAAHSVTADRINVTDLFAQDITATGTIRGLNIVGATGSFSGSITAQQGNVGGWTLSGNTMYSIGSEYFTVIRPAAKLTGSGLGVLFGIGESNGVTASKLFDPSIADRYLMAMYYDGGLDVTKLSVAEEANFSNIFITPTTDAYPALTVEGETELYGDLAVSGSISEGGTALSKKYFPVSGGTLTGALNVKAGQGVHFLTPAGTHELVIRGMGNSASHIVSVLVDNDTSRIIASVDTASETLTIVKDLNVSKKINASGTVYANGGAVSANNYGFYVKNTSGTNVSLINLNASDEAAIGNRNYPLNIYGTAITSNKPINTSSDSRLKHGIAALDDRYRDLLARLSPVTYRYDDQPEQERVGFVAQEVRDALAAAGITDSALVSEDGEGMLSIAYTELIGLLVHEVQQLRWEVEQLKRQKAEPSDEG